MKRKFTYFVMLFSMISFLASITHAGEDGWMVDFEQAKQVAAKKKKDILMDFTGSDWCGYCIQLHDNVFSKEAFKNEAPKHFVLLKLDFPKDKSNQTPQEIEQNQKLNKQFGISGYPTILLADAQGRPFGQKVGYGGDPVDQYMTSLLDLKKVRVKRDQFLAKASSAKGVEKAKLLHEAVSLFEPELAFASYRNEIDQIIALDKDNKAGLKKVYSEKIQLRDIKQKMEGILAKNQGDLPAAIRALDKMYEELKPTGEVALEILYVRSYLKFQNKDLESARADLEACLKIAPDSPRADEIRGIIQRVFSKPAGSASDKQ